MGHPVPLSDPAAADYNIAIVEYGCLTGGYGALRLVEGDKNLIVARDLNRCRGGLVAVANLDSDSHRRAEIVNGD